MRICGFIESKIFELETWGDWKRIIKKYGDRHSVFIRARNRDISTTGGCFFTNGLLKNDEVTCNYLYFDAGSKRWKLEIGTKFQLGETRETDSFLLPGEEWAVAIVNPNYTIGYIQSNLDKLLKSMKYYEDSRNKQ